MTDLEFEIEARFLCKRMGNYRFAKQGRQYLIWGPTGFIMKTISANKMHRYIVRQWRLKNGYFGTQLSAKTNTSKELPAGSGSVIEHREKDTVD